jgi:plasmid maintenance system antidote protein VapI
MEKKRHAPLTTILRKAIADCGLPFQRLEKETGVTRQTLMGFVRGERTIYLDMADKLAVFFGLELAPKRKGK